MRCIHAPQEKLELVGCYLLRKAGFGQQGFDFQFCDNQNLGQSFEKRQIDTRKPKISDLVEKSHYYGEPIKRLCDSPSQRLIDRRESSETEGFAR